MMTVKLVRSLVLGESLPNPLQNPQNLPTLFPVSPHSDTDTEPDPNPNPFDRTKKKKKMPLLLFLPTRELISDTFRLASIARDVGMDFHPSPSLSHLLFSWPHPSPNPNHYTQHFNHFNINNSIHNRTSVSSSTSVFTTASAASSSTAASSSSSAALLHHYESVPIPFPSLTTTTSVSLLRCFVSLSRGLFKLVFLDVQGGTIPNYGGTGWYGVNYEAKFGLVGRVSGKRVKCMDDLSRELAGHGWALFRSQERKRRVEVGAAVAGEEVVVYMFRKKEGNRVRAKGYNGNCGGEEGSRMKEMRLNNGLDWEKGVNLRILLYILLMTGDIFYIS